MKKLLRFAGVALLALTIGVFGCGDDETPVAPIVTVTVPTPTPPPPPPPPPVVVTMAPASQTIGVGGTVVFAVSVSGGVAGEVASWTCDSSDPSKATVTMTSAGCAATAVAVGGVTITAAVTKSGATVNTAAGLTITEDTAEPATLFITSINDDDEVLSERVSVTLDVERGDQMLMQLSVLVDGVVAVSRTYGGGASVVAAAPEGEEGERAAQQAARAVVLSFNSAAYDTDTGVPDYLNGERTISAELTVVGSDEPIESGGHPREFGNGDGVHALVSFQGDPVVNPTTGQGWYGGPDAGITVTGRLVSYSGDMVGSLTLLKVCGNKLIMDSEAPFVFDEMECKSTRVLTEADKIFRIAERDVGILNHKEVFPLRLDFEGPGAPSFEPNPNGRQSGWINAMVDLTGVNKSSSNEDGWLNAGHEDTGVGGYIRELRYSTSEPDYVKAALLVTPSSTPTLPAVTKKANEICFIASAKDALGNESPLPKDDAGCVSAADYEGLAQALSVANGLDAGDAKDEALTKARKALLVGLQGGVDITRPTAVFTQRGPDEDARELTTEFHVEVKDGGGSKIQTDAPIVASLVRRDAEDTACVVSDAEGNFKEASGLGCDAGFKSYTLADGVAVTSGIVAYAGDNIGYYTFTAEAQDNAGNLSEPAISRVALAESDANAFAFLNVASVMDKPLKHDLSLSLRDDLSIRDYFVDFSFGDADIYNAALLNQDGRFAGIPSRFRIGEVVKVDEYNAPALMEERNGDTSITLPFLFLQFEDGAPAETPVETPINVNAYVRDQRDGRSYNAESDDVNLDELAATDGFNPTVSAIDAASVTGFTLGVAPLFVAGETDEVSFGDDITLTATVMGTDQIAVAEVDGLGALPLVKFPEPFSRVDFYAVSSDRIVGTATTPAVTAGQELRFIESVYKANATEADGVGWVYEVKIDAEKIYAAVDDNDKGDYTGGMIIAFGVQEKVAKVDGKEGTAAVLGTPTTPAVAAVPAVREVVAKSGLVALVSVPKPLRSISP